MKKIVILAVFALLFSSCAIHKASVASTAVYSPEIETTTIATLDVSPERISYVYYPELKDSKRLSEKQLIRNAIFMALKENGNADELVEVNCYVSLKRGFFGKRVKSIAVAGYPAKYKNFREPTDKDKEAVEALSRSRMFRQSKLDALSMGDNTK